MPCPVLPSAKVASGVVVVDTPQFMVRGFPNGRVVSPFCGRAGGAGEGPGSIPGAVLRSEGDAKYDR